MRFHVHIRILANMRMNRIFLHSQLHHFFPSSTFSPATFQMTTSHVAFSFSPPQHGLRQGMTKNKYSCRWALYAGSFGPHETGTSAWWKQPCPVGWLWPKISNDILLCKRTLNWLELDGELNIHYCIAWILLALIGFIGFLKEERMPGKWIEIDHSSHLVEIQ